MWEFRNISSPINPFRTMPQSETIQSILQADNWLTAVMGYSVYRIAPGTLPDITGSVKSGRAFFYTKIPIRDVVLTTELLRKGFYVVDTALSFERHPEQLEAKDVGPVSIRPAAPDQHAAILLIAESSFQYSRFHLDPELPRSLANRIKREWIANSLAGKRGDSVFAATLKGETVGFMSTLSVESEGKKSLAIDLIAVLGTHQRQGVGRALVNYFIQTAGSGYDRLCIGTQAANIPSCRLYEESGFRLADAAYVLHAHTQDGTLR
jgi:ribosomal protein S18 acetylase RimI-like enzyme